MDGQHQGVRIAVNVKCRLQRVSILSSDSRFCIADRQGLPKGNHRTSLGIDSLLSPHSKSAPWEICPKLHPRHCFRGLGGWGGFMNFQVSRTVFADTKVEQSHEPVSPGATVWSPPEVDVRGGWMVYPAGPADSRGHLPLPTLPMPAQPKAPSGEEVGAAQNTAVY